MSFGTNAPICAGFRNQQQTYNPNITLNYFSQNCPDPATSLSYWRRRFRTTKCYINSFNNPYVRGGYLNGGKFSMGRTCHLLPKGSKCNQTDGCLP